MTPAPLRDHAWLKIAVGLSTSMPGELQFRRLVQAICEVLPCDAVSLLQLRDGILVPVALQGLAPELIGHQFRPSEHPRLAAILASREPVRFPDDTDLPDPFDGWLAIDPERRADVHACMGCSLYVDHQLVGALTLDALTPGVFDTVDDMTVAAFAALAAATLRNVALLHSLEQAKAQQQALAQELVQEARQREGELVGQSPVLQRLRQEIRLVASTDLAVLITGETGTGKELVARTLHAQSRRADQALVHLNCAALPESIAESELFGHCKGAFTGAVSERAGKFELADGGTLFLDEIGELPLALQAKLLRALQQGEIQRVGSDKLKRVNVRLIAATNRDLAQEVDAGRFRADLYHRLKVYPIAVPPLRAHLEDLDHLCGYFLQQARSRLGVAPVGLHPEALAALHQYDWPGNVRELEHLLLRASLKAAQQEPTRPLIRLPHLGLSAGTLAPQPMPDAQRVNNLPGLRDAVEQYQRQLIEQALARHEGNWSAAARALQLDRANLNRLAKRLGLAS
ncbi:nitric oxide reductase transcriptional regulator NorR [Pseudaeromonas paramecii]|uniref:Nitric oxide reductase transcriptional regulator NorR n=1 Tax=Pseudaeromonas paramecii TaxID=2138166 RepID=A0ABP8QCZ2_9GAMM